MRPFTGPSNILEQGGGSLTHLMPSIPWLCRRAMALPTCSTEGGGETTAQCWSLFPPGLKLILAEWGAGKAGLSR